MSESNLKISKIIPEALNYLLDLPRVMKDISEHSIFLKRAASESATKKAILDSLV